MRVQFSKVVGEFFIDAGVEKGCKGTLFDLEAQQVEVLCKEDVEAKDPLIGLAMCAVWVMETLAHHAEQPEKWIPFVNSINGLASCAAYDASGLERLIKMTQ